MYMYSLLHTQQLFDHRHIVDISNIASKLTMSSTEVVLENESKINIIGVDELQNHGINASDLQKLKTSGIHTVNVCPLSDTRKL